MLRLSLRTAHSVETEHAPSNTCKFSVETRLIASLHTNIETSISHTDGARSASTKRTNPRLSLQTKKAVLSDGFDYIIKQ